MGRKGDRRLYHFIDNLVAIGVRELAGKDKLDEEGARELMTSVAHQLCFQYARTTLYVPASLELKLTPRDEDIWQEYGQDGPDDVRKYSGARVEQLAAKYGLTTRHVYNIVGLMRRLDAARRQPGLPGIEPADAC